MTKQTENDCAGRGAAAGAADSSAEIAAALVARGVEVVAPQMTHFSPDVDPGRFHRGAVIHPGCRVRGSAAAMGPGAEIGREGPVTLVDSQLGAGAKIASGFADRCTLLDGASAGADFHGRPGTLMEERSGVAHAVGLKQTVLFPFVEFGSLINFCDAIATGGTGPRDHTEVGSGYVHFNFTPHGDKATASILGDVPRGALLRSPRIFLGGQGGLAGPRRVAFGVVVPAGVTLRRDVETEGVLVRGGSGPSRPAGGDVPWDTGRFSGIERRVANCVLYVGEVLALRAWYACARAPVMSATPWGAACLDGATRRIDEILRERIKRLEDLLAKSGAAAPPELALVRERFAAPPPAPEAGSPAAAAISALLALGEEDWTRRVQSLPESGAEALSAWLGRVRSLLD